MTNPYKRDADRTELKSVRHSKGNALRAGLLLGTAISFLPQSAVAQSTTPPPSAESAPEIVVTGTSIRGVAPVGAPLQGLSQADILKQPAATTSELLRQLPSVVGTGANDQNFSASNNANANLTGGNGINLRGLGTEATLTLLNGRRLPPAGLQGQFFDPSIIPASAIGRLEVMADGGSAIYGSDAVGGVVNILLPRNFEGAEVYARSGFADGSTNILAGGRVGKKWSSGNVMISYEHQDRTALAASSRARYTDNLIPYGGADLRLFNANPGNIQLAGTRYGIPAGQNGSALTPAQLSAASVNRESAYLGADAIPGQKRDSVLASIHQDIAPGVTLWSEGYYAHRRLVRAIGAATANLNVLSTNPFFVVPAGATAVPCPASAGVPAGTLCETVNYSFSADFGPRQQDAFQNAWQIASGVDAKLGANWKLAIYGSYGGNDEQRTHYGVNNPQLLAALRDTNRATAFNPFGAGSVTNSATLANLRGRITFGAKYRLWDFGGKLDGDLFALPAGNVKLAVGTEYQRHELLSFSDNSTGTPTTATSVYIPSTTKRQVTSVYSEVYVPVVSRLNASPGIQELSLSGAVRYDHYSDFGGTTNPKFAVRYVPVNGLALRGTYGTSFRAPTLSDIDPTTLTVGFQDFASPTGLVHALWVRGGNSSLGPERATIWSLGADLTPAALPGLKASLTYFNVSYKNRIETPGNDLLALSSAAREALLGSLVIRNPSAALVNSYQNLPQYTGVKEDPAGVAAFVDGRKVNVGRLQTSGLEGTIDYAFALGKGTLSLGASANYLLGFKRAIAPNASLAEVVNTINNPVKFRARGTVGYEQGGFSANTFVNFSGKYTNNSVTPAMEVSSYTTVDMSIRQEIGGVDAAGIKSVVLSLDVQNLFDRDPPVVLNGALSFDPQVASILGRVVTAGVRLKW